MKTQPDLKRFARYNAVVNLLLTKDSFRKSTIYEIQKNEKPQFIGRIIG